VGTVTASGAERVRVVVMVDSIRSPGGAETLAMEGAIGLAESRYDVWLCVTRWNDDLEVDEPSRSWLRRLREAGVSVLGLRRRHRLALWAWLPLLRLLRRERIEVLHAHLFGSNLWACVWGRIMRVPVVVAHEHMWSYSSSRLRPILDREVIARLSSAFVAVSEEGRRRMIEIEGIAPRDVSYVPNGTARLPEGDPDRARAALGIPTGAPVVGSVGHLRPEKAFEVLIEAVGELRGRWPDLHLVIAGEGAERPLLERIRAELGLEGRVHLPGARDDVPDLLAAFDVAVCCSDFEGGPLSVMEYMGAGLPVVGTRVGGLPELVRDGATGILVEPRDPAALSNAVARLLDDPLLAARMGEAGRLLRDEEYSLEAWIERLEQLYQRLLASRT
jgi:glycosyltransferase involved in cell wall biosynthesis